MELTKEQLIEQLKKAQATADRVEALEQDNKILKAKVQGLKAAFKGKGEDPEAEVKTWLDDLLSAD